MGMTDDSLVILNKTGKVVRALASIWQEYLNGGAHGKQALPGADFVAHTCHPSRRSRDRQGA